MKTTTEIQKGDLAFKVHQEILRRTLETAYNMLELGKLFKWIRDEKLYKFMDCGSFNTYLGQPEITWGRSTVYSFIHAFEKYVLTLGEKPDRIVSIGHRKLQIINPVVETDPQHWLALAETNSESDLRNQVRETQGKEPLKREKKDEYSIGLHSFDVEGYVDFVRNHPCIVCSDTAEAHHFPRTIGAGAKEHEVIPLCRACHSQAHNDPIDFLIMYKFQIFQYFYGMFKNCFKLLGGLE